MSFAVSPSATVPAAPSSSSAAAADPAGGGGFAALFDQVSAAAGHAASRPSPSPASKNQADPPPDDASNRPPSEANSSKPRPAAAPQPDDSTSANTNRVAEPDHAADTEATEPVAGGKPLSATTEATPTMAPAVLRVGSTDGAGMEPALLPAAPQVAVASQPPELALAHAGGWYAGTHHRQGC